MEHGREGAGSWAVGCASLLAGLNIPHSSHALICLTPLAPPGLILLAHPPVLILLFPFRVHLVDICCTSASLLSMLSPGGSKVQPLPVAQW